MALQHLMISLVSALVLTFSDSGTTFDCTWTNDGLDASFSLCELQLSSSSLSPYYQVDDERSTSNVSNFEYYFNVAADIDGVINVDACYNTTLREKEGLTLGYCDNIQNYSCHGDVETISTNTAAYQVHLDQGCSRLHDGVTPPQWSLIDSLDPTVGVQLTYSNGDWCQDYGINRELTLKFYCVDDAINTFDEEEVITEFETCKYSIELETIHGCPLECPLNSNLHLCNDEGICKLDHSNNKTKCFCYEGYSGDDCVLSTSINRNNSDSGGDSNIIYDDYKDCLFTLFDNDNISGLYNLSLFNLKTDSFMVDDFSITDFEYEFNICGGIPDIIWNNNDYVPNYCRNATSEVMNPCISINPINGTCDEYYEINNNDNNDIASAIQINENHQVCHWLGTELPSNTQLANYSVSLYDNTDSASGIRFSILNGAWCEDASSNRELIIELICPTDSNVDYFDPNDESVIKETVSEYPECIYTVQYESPLACPIDCMDISNNDEYSICSTHGICAADPNAGYVRCLCDDGWSGELCQNPTSSTTTNAPTGTGTGTAVATGTSSGGDTSGSTSDTGSSTGTQPSLSPTTEMPQQSTTNGGGSGGGSSDDSGDSSGSSSSSSSSSGDDKNGMVEISSGWFVVIILIVIILTAMITAIVIYIYNKKTRSIENQSRSNQLAKVNLDLSDTIMENETYFDENDKNNNNKKKKKLSLPKPKPKPKQKAPSSYEKL